MDPIKMTELEEGLTVRLDQLEITKYDKCVVKARAGTADPKPEDRYHSFLLLKFYDQYGLWLCAPLFSDEGIGSEKLSGKYKTGNFEGWKAPTFTSPFQQWMISPKSILGAQAELSTENDRSYYARGDAAEIQRVIDFANRNDASWVVRPQVKPVDPAPVDSE